MGARAHPAALGPRGRPHARPRPQLLRQHRRPHLGDGLPASARDARAPTARSTTRRSTTSASAPGTRWRSPTATQDFPAGTDEAKTLAAHPRGWTSRRTCCYLTNQDIDAHPRVDTWSNGTDATAELKRMMAVRKFALSRFGEQAIKRNEPMATIEEVLVPLYLHHRYQVEAATSVLGGITSSTRCAATAASRCKPAPAAEQRAALDALLETLTPSALALPRELLAKIPPRPSATASRASSSRATPARCSTRSRPRSSPPT